MASGTPRGRKFGNTPTSYGDVVYPSKLQASRAAELDLLLATGQIGDWRDGTRWTLLEPYIDPLGKKWRKVVYIPDFEVWRAGRTREFAPPDWLEDTKGVKTAAFVLKQALMARVHPTTPLVLVTKDGVQPR
jgi:hypothetical protein